jgi:SNF2 family DNA or RNA helicase
MKRDDRTRAMEALKHDPGCEVLLVSLKAGGVGLNLTAAQRVYLMDPYWNPAVENQAVDRIVRIHFLSENVHIDLAYCSTDWDKQDPSLPSN